MKGVFRMLVMLAVIAAVMMPAAAMADDTQTTASVSFVDGVLEMEDPPTGQLGMDIDFGEHALPSRAETYAANDDDHTLRVSDARSAITFWNMTALLSDFTTTDDVTPTSFQATISLASGASDAGDELTIADPVEIQSGAATPTTVLTASEALGRGTFDATWAKDDVKLSIDDTQYQNVQVADYTATLTWTLALVA